MMVETGYEKIEKALRLDRVLFYEGILVTIRVNSSIMVELLSPDPMGVSDWIWENDWGVRETFSLSVRNILGILPVWAIVYGIRKE